MKEIIIIVATATNNGIGNNNTIPWNIPEELNNFRMLTSASTPDKQNAIIMGRNTWESLPKRPLKNRLNIVVSKTMEYDAQTDNTYIVKKDIINALSYAYQEEGIDKIFIIGGAEIYRQVLDNFIHLVDKIYLSIIYDKEYKCDKFIDMEKIYQCFSFDKENIHLTERYMFMIGHNNNVCKSMLLVRDESVD